MISLPEVTFDLSQPRMGLFDAAVFFVRRGHSGPLREEFDSTTIDPLFRLIENGLVTVTGIRAGSTLIERVTDCWHTATVGNHRVAKPNFVYLEADPTEPLGSYITTAGSEQALWTHLQATTCDLVAIFDRAPTDFISVFSDAANHDQRKTARRGHGAAISAAMAVLWPKGLPRGISPKERDHALLEEMKRQGTTKKLSIDPVTFRRFFSSLEATGDK